MTEEQVGFLCKAVASLPSGQNSQPQALNILKSYYLMRCKEVTKGHGLPERHFSTKVRCVRCCIEWRNGTQCKVRSKKLSKKQRQRIKSIKSKENKESINSKNNLLNSNEVEQTCIFCHHTTITTALKPVKWKKQAFKSQGVKLNKEPIKEAVVTKKNSKKTNSKIKQDKKKPEVNVYSLTKDVFSLNHQKNIITCMRKQAPKVIKNNQKEKDKYAGLCEKAVAAAMKLKEEKNKQNKLNLFLKPSNG